MSKRYMQHDKSSDLFCFDLDQKIDVGCRPVSQKVKTSSQKNQPLEI